MITLKDLVREASLCQIIDAQTDNSYALRDVLINDLFPATESPKLVFLYLNQSFASLQILLSAYTVSHILVLLSDSTPTSLKQGLEAIYQPQFIYDTAREKISDFTRSDDIFVSAKPQLVSNFHPNTRLLLSTSGTTGSPKLVKLSEENLLANAKAITEYLPIKNDDVTPLNLSLYYSYGLSILHSNLLKQNTLVVGLPDFFSKDFWTFFEKYRFSSLAGVPYNYEILNRLSFTQKEFPSLRYMTQAGGKLPVHLVEKFGDFARKNNFPFYIMYGQTEATARMSYLPPEKLPEKPDSIGIPIPNGKFTIDKETSELFYSGPNVFGGYAESLEDLTVFEQPEFLATGDLAEECDGFFYITGRLKRMVKLFGQRVNLDETENILKKVFRETAFACAAKDDKKMFVFYNNQGVEPESIIRTLKETLLLHHSAFKIILTPEFPLTANGKINYQKLIEQYGTE